MIILQHQEKLGDHILLRGLVESLADRLNQPIRIHGLEQDRASVTALYQFSKKVSISFFESTEAVFHQYLKDQVESPFNLIVTGNAAKMPSCPLQLQSRFLPMEDLNNPDQSLPHFDELAYSQARVSFTRRELKTLPMVSGEPIPDHPYAFVHEDKTRGYLIDRSRITLPIVEVDPAKYPSIWSWMRVAQHADEVHVIDSCFLCAFEVFRLSGRPYRHFHQYATKAKYGHLPGWRQLVPTIHHSWIVHNW